MRNILLEQVEYKEKHTRFGVWKSFGYVTGLSYHEFTSHIKIGSLPLVHYTFGRCPETGRRKVAKGVIAIGRIACGIIAIGQLAIGIVPVGQAAFGLLLGIGQLSSGIIAVGQGAIGLYLGLGQFAMGHIAIGQLALGEYVLGQMGWGQHVFAINQQDEIARKFFSNLPVIRNFWIK